MGNFEQLKQNLDSQKGLNGKLKRKLFNWLMGDLISVENEFRNEQRRVDDITGELHNAKLAQEGLENKMNAELDLTKSKTEAIKRDFDNACINLSNNNAQIASLISDVDYLKIQLQRAQRQAASATVTTVVNADMKTETVVTAPASSENTYQSIEYFDFENHFRGSIESIKEAQKQYLPYFEGKKHVLDFGCGRGEFLLLMKENGINAEGVDLYEPYVDYCNSHDLKVTCGDGVKLLNSYDDIDGIFLGQVVEHLTTEQIMEVCVTAFEKLNEGGVFVAETPNPTSLSIYTNAFYIDPSHVKPVHPLTMKYYLENAGFRKIEIIYTNSSKPDKSIPKISIPGADTEEFNKAMEDLANMLYGSQDYSIIATK